MSNVKLGLLILWPTFWTGFPIKLVIGLLLLAAGLHPWEGTGLVFLLGLSIPIDIWALGLCARTVFLERLRVEPQPGLGLNLWWQWTLFHVIYLPILYFVAAGIISTAKAATTATIEFLKEHLIPGLPIAEQISIELVMWGSVATVGLIVLALGWLYGLGAITQRHVRASTQLAESYQDIVHRWDLMRVPSDQPLLLTAFMATGVVVVFLFWSFLPASTPHPHEDYEFLDAGEERPVKPSRVIKKTENVLMRATSALEELGKKEEKSRKATKVKQKAGSKKVSDRPTDSKVKSKKAKMGAEIPSQGKEQGQGDHQH